MSAARQVTPSDRDDRQGTAAIEVTVEELSAPATLAAAWQALEAEADASVFLSWAWIGTWLGTLDRPLLLARAVLDGATVGLGILVPHRLVEHRVVPIRLLSLNAVGDPKLDVITIEYNGFLARRGLEAEVTRAMLRQLRELRRRGRLRWDAVEITGAADSSLPLLQDSGLRLRVVAQNASARVDLAAARAAGKDYLATLSGNTRSQVRRAARLYGERGEVKLEVSHDTESTLAFLDEAGTLHQARWEARGRPGAFASPYFVDFHRRLIETAAPQGMAEIVRVSVGPEPIGYLYNLLHRGTVYFYLSGLRYAADNRLKPGLVTHSLAIQHYLERGFAAYDFMGGANRYKTSLGQPGPDILQLRLESTSPKLQLIHLARQTRQRLRRGE